MRQYLRRIPPAASFTFRSLFDYKESRLARYGITPRDIELYTEYETLETEKDNVPIEELGKRKTDIIRHDFRMQQLTALLESTVGVIDLAISGFSMKYDPSLLFSIALLTDGMSRLYNGNGAIGNLRKYFSQQAKKS